MSVRAQFRVCRKAFHAELFSIESFGLQISREARSGVSAFVLSIGFEFKI